VFYEWVYPLHTIHGLSALNVFRYITFRSAYAAITALLLCFVLGPPMIEWLRRVKLGQKIWRRPAGASQQRARRRWRVDLVAIVVPTLMGQSDSRELYSP
jgi:hypothetical protein